MQIDTKNTAFGVGFIKIQADEECDIFSALLYVEISNKRHKLDLGVTY